MKRAIRVVVWTGIIGFSLMILALLGSFRGLDYQPYFETGYYAKTMGRLAAATNAVHWAQGGLEVGMGRAILTPTLGGTNEDAAHGRFRAVPLAGFGNRQGKPATGVHDDVWAKAIAVRIEGQTAVWLGIDALIVPWEVADAVARQLAENPGLRREQLYLGATHTHSSLGGWGEGIVAEAFAGPFQPGVRIWMVNQMVAAARQAVADLKPGAFGQGSFPAPGFVRNRLVGARGGVDDEFAFVLFRQEAGAKAVLGSYAAHATVLGGGNYEFSADYPGAWQREVEKQTGGLTLFLAGGVGSHGPNAGGGGFEAAERMGRRLAEMLGERLPQLAMTNRTTLATLGCEVDLPELHTRLTDEWRLRPGLARRLLPVRPTTFLQAIRFGNRTWISTPCDFSGELARELKDFVRMRGGDTIVTSFNGDYLGYVIPARYYHLGGYEPRTMSFFGPDLPDYFTEVIRHLAMATVR